MTSAPRPRSSLVACWILLACAWVLACTPTYPRCEAQAHCAAQGAHCVDGRCAQCAADEHCGGLCNQCSPAGTCERIAGCCEADADCTSDMRCETRRCVPKPECEVTEDCPIGRVCEAQHCVQPELCAPVAVYFSFDEYKVRFLDQKQAIATNIACYQEHIRLLRRDVTVHLVGHTDDVGPEDYMSMLGHQYAESVRKAMISMGMDKAHIVTDSMGKLQPAEPCGCKNEKNRRVETRFE
jgi:outer membrane protein OmpA-like peptidoglycan-associated protein